MGQRQASRRIQRHVPPQMRQPVWLLSQHNQRCLRHVACHIRAQPACAAAELEQAEAGAAQAELISSCRQVGSQAASSLPGVAARCGQRGALHLCIQYPSHAG